jgi:catechol 2,3-dioxygenase-like lactoylglutathione lyase family enzyme
MDQRVSLITLGVRDVAAARDFYERLGWQVGLDVEETVFFQTGSSIVALWGREKLEADSGVTDSGSWGGITLAHNVKSGEEVDRVIRRRGRQVLGSVASRQRPSTADTPGSSSTWTAIRGKSPTTPASS